MKKVIVACDSFKDALDADEVCAAIARGIQAANKNERVEVAPLADGGEGTARILGRITGSKQVKLEVSDPLFRKVQTHYFMDTQNKRAFMDMAEASGLGRLTMAERNPSLTSTYGTGEMMVHAADHGAEKIILGIGGSATTDGGIGMAKALGFRFYDHNGIELKCRGGDMGLIAEIASPEVLLGEQIEVEVLCDVTNPLYGPDGAAFVYGPQKGADDVMVEYLDEGLGHLALLCRDQLQTNFAMHPGAGAAGGLGFGLLTFCGAKLRSGIDAVLDYSQLATHLRHAKLLITGEGRLDIQTSAGKLISGLCKMAGKWQVPVIALCGQLQLTTEQIHSLGLYGAFAINPPGTPLAEALRTTARRLEVTAEEKYRGWLKDQTG